MEVRMKKPAPRWAEKLDVFKSWTPLKRYRRERDARQALDTQARKDRMWDVRIIGPAG
jgi:hypothetical protein